MKQSGFLILGASGWIGHYLVPALRSIAPDAPITAVYRSRMPTFACPHTEKVSSHNPLEIVEAHPPVTILNLNRGEEESDFELHQQLIRVQNRRSARYVYASSFNAVDAELSRPHSEDDLPGSQSPYGQFKARCEAEMLKSCQRPAIFRFAATHGWAPNRVARTQEFLSRLSQGDEIRIKKGILQNRSFVGDLAQQIAMLAANDAAEGMFHLGTLDYSDEIDFHKELARAFGHDPDQVIEGESTQCNAVMLMQNFQKVFPDYEIPSEAVTIQKVASQVELGEFLRTRPINPSSP